MEELFNLDAIPYLEASHSWESHVCGKYEGAAGYISTRQLMYEKGCTTHWEKDIGQTMTSRAKTLLDL